MTLVEIENLSFAELKEQRVAIIAEAAKSPSAEIVARFVDARTDAKQRDERLAEMGRTITSLNDALDSKTTALREAETLINALKQESVVAKARSEEDGKTIQSITTSLRQSEANFSAAMKLAQDRRAALADIMTHAAQLQAKVAPLLAVEG